MQQALLALAGLILSAVFRYTPKLNTWYAAQADELKQLIMLGVIAVAAVITYVAGCNGVSLPLIEPVSCDTAGGKLLFEAFVMIVLGTQAGAGILPKPKEAKAAEMVGDIKREPEEKKLVEERLAEKKE